MPALPLLFASSFCQAGAAQDEIFGDGFDGFDHASCDTGLPSNSIDATQYAAVMDLCQRATETDTSWGLISAAFTLADGTGTPAAVSHAIRSNFGSGNTPRAGSAMVVLSTGAAAATGQTNPSFVAFQPGDATGTSSAAPSDWLTANGGAFPVAPGCPAAGSTTANDPVMLTLQIRVPGNARSFSLDANFLSSEFPEYVCSSYNDMFVALLDSSFAGAPANPADKNLATYIAPNTAKYPLGVNLAHGNTGLFTQCVNGTIACATSNFSTISTCTSTSELTGTGMDTPDPGNCDADSLVGGGTGWLVIRGNVVPGETVVLRLAIWDTSDQYYDSVILLDHFQWSFNVVTPGVTIM